VSRILGRWSCVVVLVVVVVVGCGESSPASGGGPSGGGTGATNLAGSAGTQAGHAGTGARSGRGGTPALGGEGGGEDSDSGAHGTTESGGASPRAGSSARGGTGALGGASGTGGEAAASGFGSCNDDDNDWYYAPPCTGMEAPDDCNDADRSIHPGAQETPGDGIDSDCDGLELCYRDLDGDGYGLPMQSEHFDCDGPGESSVEPEGVDCDDTNAYRRSYITGYVDEDGDGFGSGILYSVCSGAFLPSGYAPNSDDCDDEDPTVWPGQSEVPGDGIDQDCSGGDTPLDAAHAVFVDATCSGSCGDGTKDSPATSIAEALALATSEQALVLAEGTYAGGFTTSRSILGGYATGTWQRDIEAHPTTIESSAELGLPLIGIDEDATVVLSGLTLAYVGDGAKSGVSIDHASVTLDHVALTLATTSKRSLAGVWSWGQKLVIVDSSITTGDATAYLLGGGGSNVGVFFGGKGVVAIRDSSIATGRAGDPGPAGSALGCEAFVPEAVEQQVLVENTTIRSDNQGVYAPIVHIAGAYVAPEAAHPLSRTSARFIGNRTIAGENTWGIQTSADLIFAANEVRGGNGSLTLEAGYVANSVFWPVGDAISVGRSVQAVNNTIHATAGRGIGGSDVVAVVVNTIFSGVVQPVWITDGDGEARVVSFGNDFFGAGGYPVNDAEGPDAVDTCDWHGCVAASGNRGVDPELDLDGIHLQTASPLRDAGEYVEWWYLSNRPTEDIDGDPRVDAPDVGADELD
jgi:hypothetical protein